MLERGRRGLVGMVWLMVLLILWGRSLWLVGGWRIEVVDGLLRVLDVLAWMSVRLRLLLAAVVLRLVEAVEGHCLIVVGEDLLFL